MGEEGPTCPVETLVLLQQGWQGSGPFRLVAVMHMWWYQLVGTAIVGYSLEECAAGLVVKDVGVGAACQLMRRLNIVLYAIMQWASFFDWKGCTKMALVSLWRATMMYWLPLRARAVKRPVSSVKIWLMGAIWVPMECGCPVASAGATLGATSCMERMCCLGCAMWPDNVSSELGQ